MIGKKVYLIMALKKEIDFTYKMFKEIKISFCFYCQNLSLKVSDCFNFKKSKHIFVFICENCNKYSVKYDLEI